MNDRVFIVLSDEDCTRLHRIEVDKDHEEALAFLLERVVPQARKKRSCLDARLARERK